MNNLPSNVKIIGSLAIVALALFSIVLINPLAHAMSAPIGLYHQFQVVVGQCEHASEKIIANCFGSAPPGPTCNEDAIKECKSDCNARLNLYKGECAATCAAAIPTGGEGQCKGVAGGGTPQCSSSGNCEAEGTIRLSCNCVFAPN